MVNTGHSIPDNSHVNQLPRRKRMNIIASVDAEEQLAKLQQLSVQGPLEWQGRRTRSGRSGPDPTNFFAFFFFFFLSFEANGFARSKLNEIEHYKLDESKGRCPWETFFVSRFSPAFPNARRRHPSLRYNFSRHLLSILHVIYILSTYVYKTHSGPQHIPVHATLRPRCHPKLVVVVVVVDLFI